MIEISRDEIISRLKIIGIEFLEPLKNNINYKTLYMLYSIMENSVEEQKNQEQIKILKKEIEDLEHNQK